MRTWLGGAPGLEGAALGGEGVEGSRSLALSLAQYSMAVLSRTAAPHDVPDYCAGEHRTPAMEVISVHAQYQGEARARGLLGVGFFFKQQGATANQISPVQVQPPCQSCLEGFGSTRTVYSMFTQYDVLQLERGHSHSLQQKDVSCSIVQSPVHA